MTDPWESLRVNDRRQILIADNGQNGGGGPEVDIYDLSGDCRHAAAALPRWPSAPASRTAASCRRSRSSATKATSRPTA